MIFSFLFGKKSRSFAKSSNKETYERIASTFGIKAEEVFDLAHGRKPKSNIELEIIEQLAEAGIIGKKR